ncbi:MAG: head-tail joining protein [Janthinobacterium lividum]
MIDWDAVCNAPVMAVFGELAQFQPYNADPFDVHGTFHEAYKSIDLAGGMGITTESPAFGIRLAEFALPPGQRDEIRITPTNLHGGGVYTVKEVQPNGIGAAVLILNWVRD